MLKYWQHRNRVELHGLNSDFTDCWFAIGDAEGVDIHFGCEMPQDLREMLQTARRLELHVSFPDKWDGEKMGVFEGRVITGTLKIGKVHFEEA